MNFLKRLCIAVVISVCSSKAAPVADIEVMTYQWAQTGDFPQKILFFILAGGTSTGKSTVLDKLRIDKEFILSVKNIVASHYQAPPSITVAFLDEVPIKVIKEWKQTGKFQKMIQLLNNNDKSLFRELQTNILFRQLKQINALPSTGIVIVITDRYIFDIIGYCKVNGLSNDFIKQISDKYMVSDHIERVFMFKDYIPDKSKSNNRFAEFGEQEKESIKSYEAINKVYKGAISASKLLYMSYDKKINFKQSLINRINLIKKIIIKDLQRIYS